MREKRINYIWLSLIMVLMINAFSLGQEKNHQDYLTIVKAYADVLIEEGRDEYGTRHSPLFASALDREKHRLLSGAKLMEVKNLKREEWGIRNNDRSLTGANPMHDQNLYQILYALSLLTGEEKYAEEADKALSWFFQNCQSKSTGLMAWGEHMGWDFLNEKPITGESYHQKGTHEFFRPWVLWDKSFQLAPEQCKTFATGLWNHQIGDQKTGNFSRHATYYEHNPGHNSHYPRHGGFYINTWGSAYEKTKEKIFLKPIETLVNFYSGQRSLYSGGIPAETHHRSEGMLMWPHSNLSLVIDMHNVADYLPSELSGMMKEQGTFTDTVFLNIKHDLEPEGRGFVKAANTNTLAPSDVRGQDRLVYTRLWATGYGEATDAKIANLCMLRYRQTGNESYKKLIIKTAKRYFQSQPDISFPIYPETLGNVVWIFLNAYELTSEDNYLKAADNFAKIAIDMFTDDTSPLPKASNQHDHYEAITGGDLMMMSLLKLWALKENKSEMMSLVYTDR